MPDRIVLRLREGSPAPPCPLDRLIGRPVHRDLLTLEPDGAGTLSVDGYVITPTGEVEDCADGSPAEVYEVAYRPAH